MNFDKISITAISILLTVINVNAQVVLNANGVDDTYHLINSVLAPGNNVVETPDCIHTDVKHVDQVFDADLDKYVFRFKAHKHPDNDRCQKYDRQRTEIKTYDKSPDNLKAALDEIVRYTWNFKLSSDFKPSSSFTHLHQIKAVDGPHDAMPLITLTARKSSPDRLELRYGEELSQITLTEIPLADFKGEWVSVKETIHFQEKNQATYKLKIIKMSDSSVLLEYTNKTIKMWKTDAAFLRPKWGIYRSLLDSNSLKDEDVLFSDIVVAELNTLGVQIEQKNEYQISPNPCRDVITFSKQISLDFNQYHISDLSGKVIKVSQKIADSIDVSDLGPGIYFIQFLSTYTGAVSRQKIVKHQ
jgi:hypothetical protein